jgi:hypothetical protein
MWPFPGLFLEHFLKLVIRSSYGKRYSSREIQKQEGQKIRAVCDLERSVSYQANRLFHSWF